MKTKLLGLALSATVLLVAGCSTVDSRIEKNRAAFNSWPAPVQAQVVKGEIGVGFTPEQVRVALGEPDRVWSRTSPDGTTEVWSYRDRKPHFSFGVGVGGGSFNGSRGTFGGVGIQTGTGYNDDEKMGVVFDRTGKVTRIETTERVR